MFEHLIGTIIDKSNPAYAAFPASLDGQRYLGGRDVTGGWKTEKVESLQDREDRRKSTIREIAEERINKYVLGSLENGETEVSMAITKLTTALITLATDLIQAGVIQLNDLDPSLRALRQSSLDVVGIRQAALSAIQNGDTPNTFRTNLNQAYP